jgi:hypothetical protein
VEWKRIVLGFPANLPIEDYPQTSPT